MPAKSRPIYWEWSAHFPQHQSQQIALRIWWFPRWGKNVFQELQNSGLQSLSGKKKRMEVELCLWNIPAGARACCCLLKASISMVLTVAVAGVPVCVCYREKKTNHRSSICRWSDTRREFTNGSKEPSTEQVLQNSCTTKETRLIQDLLWSSSCPQ